MDVTLIMGSAGATLILIAFFLNQIHKISNDSLIYDIMNFVGGAILLTYAILLSSAPFAVLNAVWAGVSLRDIFSDLKKRR